MSLMVEALGTRGRILASIGIPVPMPVAPRMPSTRAWHRSLKRLLAPLVLAACDLVEVTIEAVGFGLLLTLFLFSIFMLG